MISVRALTPADVGWVVAIERTVQATPWQAEHFSGCWIEGSPQSGWGGWLKNTPVGYVVGLWVEEESHLLNLAVAREYHRRGYGRALLDYFLRECAARGTKRVFLEVRADNEAALGLYTQAGFRRLGERRGYYRLADGSRIDAVVMIRGEEG